MIVASASKFSNVLTGTVRTNDDTVFSGDTNWYTHGGDTITASFTVLQQGTYEYNSYNSGAGTNSGSITIGSTTVAGAGEMQIAANTTCTFTQYAPVGGGMHYGSLSLIKK